MAGKYMDFKSLMPVYNKVEGVKYKYRFTVFTSAYNAESTLERTHDSLDKQTFTDFEWLVINDGSTDDTDQVMNKIMARSDLNIRYINNKVNKHKMSCFFQAIQIAEGELFLTFDADDECIPVALEVFDREYRQVPEIMKDFVIAVTGLCRDEHGNLVGDQYPADPYYSNPFEIYAIDKVDGEKWGFTQTSKLKGIQYNPELLNHGYIPEGIIWNLLGKQGYRTKYINKILRTYYTGVENSISDSPIAKTAVGSTVHYIGNINWHFKRYWFKTPIYFMKHLYYVLRFSNYMNYDLRSYTQSIEPPLIRFIFTILWPFRKIFK